MDFALSVANGIKLKKSEKKDMYRKLVKELKKNMEHEGDDFTNRDWCFFYSHQKIIKGTGGFGGCKDEWRISKLQNGQNTEKSIGYLSRVAVTQTL